MCAIPRRGSASLSTSYERYYHAWTDGHTQQRQGCAHTTRFEHNTPSNTTSGVSSSVDRTRARKTNFQRTNNNSIDLSYWAVGRRHKNKTEKRRGLMYSSGSVAPQGSGPEMKKSTVKDETNYEEWRRNKKATNKKIHSQKSLCLVSERQCWRQAATLVYQQI